ncbi:MAG: bi-domain-containing oxidoreductase [Desulfobacteraceae bacterium]|nr:bi-domain-containing oxidoreductase [Desulfobacteraceae bacterium]
MKQILQNLGNGKTELVEIPAPGLKNRYINVKTSASLISAGTERMLIDFGKANFIEKARQQPEKVKMVLDKIKTDGLLPTIDAVRSKLDQPLPLGYCNVGVIDEVGQSGKKFFKPGDRVVSNGPHAEYVCVPENLCARVPDSVSDEDAAFTVAGAIALQGIRLAEPTIGETFVVTGLGLLGQIAVQIFIANGCRVIGIDFETEKCEKAQKFGAQIVNLSKGENPVEAAQAITNSRGVDGVIITAATKSNEPVQQAAHMCRKRGRIVLVGVTGLELNRNDFFEKEISFQVSCSYGPGRYDNEYEEKGNDYPIGYVRWTEQRNFEAILDLMADGKIDMSSLVSHKFEFDNAVKAYTMIANQSEPYMGILLKYNKEHKDIKQRTIVLKDSLSKETESAAVVGLIGAGNFTGQILLPGLKKTGARLKTIASGSGVTGTHIGKKFGFEESITETEAIFNDPEINSVFITTRHNSHAGFIKQALNAGKNIFVEKPLCLNLEELKEIDDLYCSSRKLLMVGFNRRFSPHSVKIKELLEPLKEPKSFIMTVNAGHIPSDHWTQDLKVGGGRIVGEACHFIDLLRFFADCKIIKSEICKMEAGARDTVSIQLTFEDGSLGSIHYFANGNKSFPKERLEVFCAGKILQMDNFKTLTGYGWENFNKLNLWRQDKGHANGLKAFIKAVTDNNNVQPVPFEEIIEVSKISIELSE